MLIEWEDDLVVLVDLQGARRATHFPHNLRHSAKFENVPQRHISEIVVHHSKGGFYEGLEAVERLASYFLRPPSYRTENGSLVRGHNGQPIVIGGGKGWPGIPYTFVIPASPEVRSGKWVIYRIWPDTMRTWHTGGVHNSYGVGICVGGWYASAGDRLAKGSRPKPEDSALACLDRLVGYLSARYRLPLRPGTLLAHREAGATACPGDYLSEWVRRRRGEELPPPVVGVEDWRPLETVRQVQQALVDVGIDPGPVDGIMGPLTANGIKAFQGISGLRRDGDFGPKTERALRLALGALGATPRP